MQRLLAAVVLLLSLTGCSLAPAASSKMIVIPDVPVFAPQIRNDDCGSVALASLLEHAGYTVSPAVIDRHIYDPLLRGSLLPDMENYAAGLGAQTRSGRGDLAWLRARLTGGVPVLVPIDMGLGIWRRPHYVVVFGFDPQSFLIHQRQGAPSTMSAAELDRRWEKMGRLYLYLE